MTGMTASGRYGAHDNGLPPRQICVPTMMHSGTRVLRANILKSRLYHADGYLFDNNEMRNFHLTECDHYPNDLKLPIFTTLRHPRRMMESYRIRASKRTSPRYPYNQETFDWQWRELIDRIAPLKPMYLHVDADCRDKEVDMMAEFLQLPLEHNWEVQGNCGTENIPLEDCPEANQEYIDFYYGTMP